MKYKTELRALAQLTKMSKNDISEPLQIVRSNALFQPTQDMIDSAELGLKQVEEGAKASKLRVSVANDIASGKDLSISAVNRINKYFSRNGEDTVSDNLYGGQEGKAWASDVINKDTLRSKASEELDPDLLRMKSVLVSQGMNLNDDVFLKEELVRARSTGANKPVNIEHEDSDIIGHILSTYAVSKDGHILEDLDDIDIEEEIDIVNEAVIYAYIFPEIAGRIQSLASRNQLFVSVEAWFSEYDYLLGGEIIKRTEATSSVLEGHLRINGGDGNFQGKKVARVLRSIMFGGVGVVATPANPESLILEVGDVENAMASEEVVLASHVIGEYRESNDLREALKEENMGDEVQKDDLDLSTDETNIDLQEQHQEVQESEEATPSVTASDNDSTEENKDADMTLTVKFVVDDSEVVEALSQADVVVDTEVVADESESIEASTESEIEDSVEEIENSDNSQVEETEAQLDSVEADLFGAHDHPEIMARVAELEFVIGTMTGMFAKQNDIIASLDEKVVLLESEAVIAQRHNDLVQAGLSEELISSRMQKAVLMDKDEFNSYIEDIKGIVKASEVVEEKEEKQVEQEQTTASSEEEIVEVSEFNLDEIEPTSTEMNIEENNPVSDTIHDKFLKVVSSMVTKNKRKR